MIAPRVLGILLGLTLLIGCARPIPIPNPVTQNEVQTNRVIGDDRSGYQVVGKAALGSAVAGNRIFTPESEVGGLLLRGLASGTSVPVGGSGSNLVLGFPTSLIGERQVFGGVITAVSDKNNEDLGGLKLTDLTPVHVRTAILDAGGGKFVFSLLGCTENCTEGSEEKQILAVPVVGLDRDQQTVLIDLGTVGDELNLIKTIDPEGSYTKLKTKSSKTVSIDYSLSTLVFDVEVTMVPIETLVNPPPETVITIRWYLRLTSTFNPAFTARGATKGVGFFMTERSAEPVIERRSLPLAGTALIAPQRVHYFLKNIPEQFKASFRASFDEWNGHFKDLLGQELLSYDFVAVNDPRSVLLVTGDPRFNIVEWDVVNAAPYGGLGPSIANQFTGEMLTSNVLIQGPRILKIYSTWFQASETAREMSARGDENGANRVMRDFARSVRADEESTAKTRFKIDIGQRLHFRVRSEDPQVSDPIMQREDFDPIPTGFTFESYMPGYFEDMLEHELGHNFGLRHNFRGSLKGAETPVLGKVSASCMDYLGRGFRYLDRVGPYDRVAISYGYLGKLPMETGAFCTDDDVADVENLENSAECSRDDATPDPYSFFEKRLDRAIGLLVNKGSPEAPIWSLDDMKREFTVAINGLGLYGATAEVTGDTWSNFFGVAGRPNSAKRVKEFVSKDLSLRLCDPALNDVVSAKSGEAAKAATLANITAMRKRALELLTPMKALEASGLGCQ